MISRAQLLVSLVDLAEWSFSRSSGAGGQNVNKVNTRSTLRVELDRLTLLSEAQRDRVRQHLSSRLFDGALTLHVQDERTQARNREIALERLAGLILEAIVPPKARHKTKPTRASRERRLTAKRSQALKKDIRSARSFE